MRGKLEAIVRSRRASTGRALRARIVLLAARGVSNAAIARELRCEANTVRKWRERFRACPKLRTLEDEVREFLRSRKALKHLRVRRRADLLTLESGPPSDPVRHARLRRVTVQYWTVECATHTGRWEKTGIRGPFEKVLEVLTTEIAWALAPVV